MEEVASTLRACLMTSKGGVPLENVNRDYRSLEGENIPYRRLGFTSLEDFISKVPRLRQYQRGGVTYVEVIPDENTAHLAELINRQRSSKKRRKPLRMPSSWSSRRPTLNNFTPRSSTRPPPRVQMFPLRAQASPQRPQRPHLTQPARSHPPSVTVYPGTVTVYPAKAPDQLPPSAKTQQTLPQRLQTVQNPRQTPQSHHQPLQSRQQTPQSPQNPSKSPREPLQKIVISQTPLTPSKAPQSAPVTNGAAARQVNRQNSMPHLIPATTKGSRAIPPLKVARPLSDRLRRSPERKVTFSPEIGASSPPILTPVTSPAPLTPPCDTADPREKLKTLGRRLHLSPTEPEYKNVPIESKNGKISFFSLVQVGKRTFKSYPLEAQTPEDAEKLAALAALNELQLNEQPIKMRVTTDGEVMLQRLVAIVEGHPSGVFEEKLPDFYMEKHNETLPDDWMSFVETCRELSVERGVENAAIVCRCDPAVDRILTPPPTPSSPGRVLNPHSGADTSLSPLPLPVDNLWPVYVSHVASTCEIWIRLLEDKTTEPFYEMCQEMSAHFSRISPISCQVEPFHYYVTKVGDEYQRVRVEFLEEEGSLAECFFIDTGEEDFVDTSLLYDVPAAFLRVPAQAIRASLSRHEEVPVCSTTTEVAKEMLIDRAFYLQVLSREEDSTSHAVVGVFYDTSSEKDEEMSEKIVAEVLRVMQLTQLEVLLANKGGLLEVFISHIEYNGDVSLQVKNDGLIILSGMMNSLIDSALNDEEKVKKARVSGPLDPKELYLIQKSDGSWVRVQVAFPGATNSKLRMVDFGGLMDADRSKLLRLRELSEGIARFPAQAIQVELSNVRKTNFSESSAARLRHLAPPTQLLLCKVVQVREYSRSAVVELFKRSEPDNLLISINNTLDLEPELSKNGDGNNNVKTRKRLERTISRNSTGDDSSRKLKEPKIPGIEEFFEVHVTESAANPGNFIVQPIESRERLEGMMKSMQEVYARVSKGTVDVKEDRVYAIQDNDGLWYRASVNKIIGEHQVTVYLSDFGMIRLIGVEQVQLLRKEFFELPYQAIKAKLMGVHPKHGDWSLASCLRFQELVVNKDFVSKVKKLQQDNSVHNGFVLGLELIDVSSKDDVHIDKVLIEEKWAIPSAQ
ncbi:tudor domain-containing protein 7 [Diachasma alloeum]|uniref:tudor domain-containing protein 7 n=1 Tax=Diachasma alloeum TaxID=454923 RepID=UPI0007382143|nr:tudor domain-containing protein 7 [Diachasma alloeum]XP_015110570.1 tudor domain-containing protein 7 [Diachasma alloeum]XP_015110571.1 tudor domain-containing protein 7 [Diachasma alloeum]